MALPPSAPAPQARPRSTPWLAIGIPALLVLLVAALFGARLWLDAFLRSADFRHFLDRKTSALLHADCRLEPLQWQGSEVYSDALAGSGDGSSPWSRLSAEQIRAELNLRALWQRVWRIETLQVGKVDAALGASAPPTATEPTAPSAAAPAPGWLPTRVEVGRIDVAALGLAWNAGQLQGTELTIRPRQDEHSWDVTGRKGRLTQATLPALLVDQFALKTNTHVLTITQANARVEGGGQLDCTGDLQLDGDRTLDVDANFDGIPSDSFLPPDWRARLHGLASGTVHLTGSPGQPGGWQAHGHIDLHQGRIEALPVLDELAIFTATAQFRQAALQKGSADFDWRAGDLTVSHLLLESSGLIRLEGGFTVREAQIAGQVHVGIANSAGRLLAGIGARVFDEPSRDGYLWTTVNLSGPVRAPHEDLTGRLVQATQQEVIHKAQQGANTVLDTAGSLLNLLKTP